jgi:hypothetical protein
VTGVRKALTTVVLVASVLLVGLGAATVASAGYQGSGSLSCSPNPAPAGATVTCTATGFEPGADVTFSTGGSTIGTATADSAGTASISFTAPGGTVTVLAAGLGADGAVLELSTQLVVGAAVVTPTPDASPGDDLPVTGTSRTASFVRVGLALVAAGGLTVLATRRRSPAPTAA